MVDIHNEENPEWSQVVPVVRAFNLKLEFHSTKRLVVRLGHQIGKPDDNISNTKFT